MKYKEFGNEQNPTIILLHSERLSWWSFKEIADLLKTDYHVVAPVIDGHGEDGETIFHSIQESAQKVIQYIDVNHKVRVLMICGVSLGAQITVEILSKWAEATEYAIIESTLVVPRKNPLWYKFIESKLVYELSQQKWLTKLMSKALCVKPEMFSQYYQDNLHISYASWRNIEKAEPGTLLLYCFVQLMPKF